MRYPKSLVIALLLVGSFFLGGCSLVSQPTDVSVESPTTIITGKIIVSGDMVSITSSGKVIEITSRKIDLKQFKDKEVTVTGEYSGTTLFVDAVN